jgi:hypothetical protein
VKGQLKYYVLFQSGLSLDCYVPMCYHIYLFRYTVTCYNFASQWNLFFKGHCLRFIPNRCVVLCEVRSALCMWPYDCP